MLLCARLSFVRVAVASTTLVFVMCGMAQRVSAAVLETYTTSLTTYCPASASLGQDIRPTHYARGVGLDGSIRAAALQPWALAANPFAESSISTLGSVRLDTGAYGAISTDLSLYAEVRWPIGRSYNPLQVTSGGSSRDSDGYQGRDWMQCSQSELTLHNGATDDLDILYLIYGADRFLEFKRQGTMGTAFNTFKGINGAGGAVLYVAGSPDTYVYYDIHGTKTYFFGGNTSSNRADWQIWKIVDPAGNMAYVGDPTTASTAVTSGYDANGNITTAYDSFGADGRRFTYSYSTIDSVVRLTEVTAETKASGSWSSPSGVVEVARVTYGYYQTGDHTYGDDGCLKSVRVRMALSDSGSSLSSGIYAEYNTLYHYWTGGYDAGSDNFGDPYMLKLVVAPEGYRRADLLADSNLDRDPDSMSTDDLTAYADSYFAYDTDRRVMQTWSNGQCGCSGSPNGLHLLSYDDGGATFTGSYDTAWKTRTIIQPPEGAWTTQYFDEVGQSLTRIQSDITPLSATFSTGVWGNGVGRDSSGVANVFATREAFDDYKHVGDLSDPAGTLITKSGQGLVRKSKLEGSGDLVGFVLERRFGAGTSFNPNSSGGTLESATTYTTPTLAVGSINVVRPLVDSSRQFSQEISSGTTGSYVTVYDFDEFHSGDAALMPKHVITTYPAVDGGNNGSGSSTTSERYLRADGSVAFHKSAKGVWSYTQFVDGVKVKEIIDAQTDHATDYASGEDPQDDFDIVDDSSVGARLVTSYTYDAVGQVDETTLPNARVTKSYYSRLGDGRLVVLSFPKKDGSDLYGPANYTILNLAGKPEFQATVSFSGTSGETSSGLSSIIDEGDSDPITALDVGSVKQLSTTILDDSGTRVLERRTYFAVPASGAGDDSSNYDPTIYGYDNLGRLLRTKDATGTIVRTEVDELGRTIEEWIGTNDNGETDPDGEGSGSNNMTKTQVQEYDGGSLSGNGHLTKRIIDPDGDWGDDSDQRTTEYLFDYRGRPITVLNPESPHTVTAYDNMGRATAVGRYSSPSGLSASSVPTSTTNRVAFEQTFFDEMGRVYRTTRHEVNQSNGASVASLDTDTWYDEEDRVIKVDGEQLLKTEYDRLGRPVVQYTLANVDDSDYADAYDVDGDIVLEETRTGFELTTGLPLIQSTVHRHHDDKGGGETTGALDTNADSDPLEITASNVTGRIDITATWYDTLSRKIESVWYGTHGIVGDGSTGTGTLDRSGLSVPTRSATELRTTTNYNKDGTVLEVIDPRGISTRYLYDNARRRTAVIANYVNGTPSGATGADDVYTRYVYTDGFRTAYHVDEDGDGVQDSGEQVTTYTYGVSKGSGAGDSNMASGRLLLKVVYPDTESGETEANHRRSYAYNTQGQPIWEKDPAGNIVETLYDGAGRVAHKCVTTLASGFDNAVLRISTSYNDRGMVEAVTQHDDETPGSGSVVNAVRSEFDGWGNLTSYAEDRDSALGAGTPNDFDVSYLYEVADGAGRNTIRRTRQTIQYAGSTIEWIGYEYLSSSDRFDDDASRVTELVSKDSVTYATYDYNGVGTVVGIEYPEPEVFMRRYGSSQGDYPELDQFNRPVHSTWTKDLSTDVDFYDVDLSYDENSNLTWSEDNVYPGRDVVYTVDALDRLTDADEGSRSGGSITGRKRREQWTLQQTGNWDLFKLDLNGDGDWSDTGEVQDKGTFLTSGGTSFNELRGRDIDNNSSVDVTREYDKNGNLIDDSLVYEYKYDAFNRLRVLLDRDDGTTVMHEYTYNGLGHRVGWWNFSDNQWVYFAYDESWRMVASYRETNDWPKEMFVNHQAGAGGITMALGIDACVARLKDASVSWTTDSDEVFDERVYYCQELRSGRADVVHLIYADGSRVESVRYSSYGVPFGIPIADYDGDGDKDSADTTILSNAFNTSAGGGSYNVAADSNLDGYVNSADLSIHNAYSGGTLGRGNMSRAIVRNRKGYAGYEYDGIVDTIAHVRNRAYESELGRWMQRDSLGFIDGPNEYGYAKDQPMVGVDPSGQVTLLPAVCGRRGGGPDHIDNSGPPIGPTIGVRNPRFSAVPCIAWEYTQGVTRIDDSDVKSSVTRIGGRDVEWKLRHFNDTRCPSMNTWELTLSDWSASKKMAGETIERPLIARASVSSGCSGPDAVGGRIVSGSAECNSAYDAVDLPPLYSSALLELDAGETGVGLVGSAGAMWLKSKGLISSPAIAPPALGIQYVACREWGCRCTQEAPPGGVQ